MKSADMNSIDSNPKSDVDFEDIFTDVKESESSIALQVPKL